MLNMQLVLVESPVKSNTIQRFLGSNYKVLATYGHIRDLPENELGVDVENNFLPKYIIPTKARKTVKLLKDETKKADLIILSTDPDREGEAIAWHIAQALKLVKFQSAIRQRRRRTSSKPYQRITFHEITKQAIENALKNPREIDANLVDSQQARRILDRLVGYKLSPFLWKKVLRGLSAGRVQSVAVRLVVEREREIQGFKPQEYWNIEALLRKFSIFNDQFSNKPQVSNSNPPSASGGDGQTPNHKTEFKASLIAKDDKPIPKLGIKNKKEADKIVKDLDGAEYKVVKIEKNEAKRNPLPPFTTSTLQQEAWQRLHFPAKFTMQIAQSLYENGLISYHRTDSLNLSEQSLFSAKKFISEKYGADYWAGFFRKYKAKGNVQEAHEAIRPTDPFKVPSSFAKATEDKARGDAPTKLYELIWRRFIACQMAAAVFDATTADVEATKSPSFAKATEDKEIPIRLRQLADGGQVPRYIFRASGQVLKFAGFLKVYPLKFTESELPVLENNELLELIKLIPSQHFTEPPARYTEATLIKALEEQGIGRPSTYAPIISTIQERNYVAKNAEKRFVPSEIGVAVNDLLVEHFPKIVDIKFTAKMEEDLDEIARGKKQWVAVIGGFYSEFNENLSQKYETVAKKSLVEETDKKCPQCGAPLVIRFGRFGKFLACSTFPKCKYTEKLAKPSLGLKCPKCGKGEVVERNTKRKKVFYGCSLWPKCDFAVWDKPTGQNCEKCGAPLVETKRKQTRCSNKDCETNLSHRRKSR